MIRRPDMRGYVTWIIRHRLAVLGLTVVVTVLLASQIRHLRVIVDPNALAPPRHPYVIATNRVEELFGSKYVVMVGITPKQGDVYQPAVLAEVQRMTAAFLETPGVIKANVLSLSARRAKQVTGTPDGMEVRPLMETVPQTPEALAALRRAVRANPVYLNAIVSRDERTAVVIAELRFDVRQGGFRWIADSARRIAEQGRHPDVDAIVGGGPVFTAEIERRSQRMALLFPLAVLATGLIHYHAFRTLQGLILPLGPFVKNPFFFMVVGADRTFFEDYSVNLQYIVRVIAGFVRPASETDGLRRGVAIQEAVLTNQLDAVQQAAALRLNGRWLNQTLEAEAALVISLTRLDYAVRPKIVYALSDRWKLTLGADIFGGHQPSLFGRLRANTGAYTELRWSF